MEGGGGGGEHDDSRARARCRLRIEIALCKGRHRCEGIFIRNRVIAGSFLKEILKMFNPFISGWRLF